MNDRTHVKGVITDDPAVTMPPGSSVTFCSVLLTHDFNAEAVWLDDWQSPDGVLLSMHFASKAEKWIKVEGSAVLVAPGVALCATHVIEPHADTLMASATGVICIAIARHGLNIWRVRKVSNVPNTDLTLLGLSLASAPPPTGMFYQAAITTRLPRVGEKLAITGFRAIADESKIVGSKEFSISGRVLVCTGEVSERYLKRRDASFVRWPALEVQCPAWGGMSGGPVFDERGLLVGLLCSSFGDAGPSYVSLLWPALTHGFQGGWPEVLFTQERSLLTLDPRYVLIDRPEAVGVRQTDFGQVEAFYTPWEV